jgi:WD40 repeat protein
MIVTASRDKTSIVYSTITGDKLYSLEQHKSVVSCASFSPNNMFLLTGSFDSTAKLWNAQSGEFIRDVARPNSPVLSASFSPDGSYVATGSSDNMTRIWSTETGLLLQTLSGHSAPVTAVSFCPNSKYLVTGSEDRSTIVYDITTWKSLCVNGAHSGWINCINFSPDGQKYITSSVAAEPQVWNVTSGTLVLTLLSQTNSLLSISCSHTGELIAAGSLDNTVETWELQTGKATNVLGGHRDAVMTVAFSPVQDLLLTGGEDDTVTAWDPIGGDPIKTLVQHSETVFNITFSRDGRLFITSSKDQTAVVWNTAGLSAFRLLSGHDADLTCASFSPDGQNVATGSFDGTVRIQHIQSNSLVESLAPNLGVISSVSYSPNGDQIAIGASRGIAVWSFKNRTFRYFSGHVNRVSSVLFYQKGTLLVSGSRDNTAVIWHVETGLPLCKLAGHTGWVNSVICTPDEKYILTASEDTTVKVWDAKCGKLLFTRYHFLKGSWIAVAPDGRYDSSEGPTPNYGHFVIATPNGPEAVQFHQLSTSQYYEPNLIQKILNGNYQPGDVPLSKIRPFPHVLQKVEQNQLQFSVNDQGGGVGVVEVFVGGQIIKSYDEGAIASGESNTLDLSTWFKHGQLPVTVVAWNNQNTLSSPLSKDMSNDEAQPAPADETPVRFVGIFIGSEKYSLGTLSPLNFAGDDAVAMANATQIMVKGLGITPELFVLSDEAGLSGTQHPVAVSKLLPTRENFDNIIDKLSKSAFTSNDIIMIYLSGHGITVGAKKGDYLYLLPSARTSAAKELVDPEVKRQSGITSEEILNLFEHAIASKRILIVDTCHAEAAASLQTLNLNLAPISNKWPWPKSNENLVVQKFSLDVQRIPAAMRIRASGTA